MTNGRAAGGPGPGALASESDDAGVTVPGTGVAGGHSGSVGLPPSAGHWHYCHRDGARAAAYGAAVPRPVAARV